MIIDDFHTFFEGLAFSDMKGEGFFYLSL